MTIPGWGVSLAVLAPNLLLLAFPARGVAPAARASRRHRWLAWSETVTRVLVLAVPLFLVFPVTDLVSWICLGVVLLCLALYYAEWAAFFARGRERTALYRPLGPLPVPMAVAPSVYFLAFALMARSPLYAGVAAAFGAAHVLAALDDARGSEGTGIDTPPSARP